MHRYEAASVVSAAEAEDVLRRETFDVVVLDLSTPGTAALAASIEAPVILLASPGDEPLAMSLVRQGAQDYLLRTEVDCVPLAHALWCASERHRLLAGWRSLAMMDPVTGLYDAGGFTSLAERYWAIAAEVGVRLLVFHAEVDAQGEISLMDAVAKVRGAFGDIDLVGRTGPADLSAISLRVAAAEEIRRQCAGLRFSLTLKDPVRESPDQALCENGLRLAANCASPWTQPTAPAATSRASASTPQKS
ncbi:MAG: hypothetical protein ACRD44_09275 [Bryobacteraceae bacterium]